MDPIKRRAVLIRLNLQRPACSRRIRATMRLVHAQISTLGYPVIQYNETKIIEGNGTATVNKAGQFPFKKGSSDVLGNSQHSRKVLNP